MQATGQYGEVPQYVGSRVGASHGHMFNIAHEMSLSSTVSGQGQGQGQGQASGLGHGHGLSLSHPPHSQASQSHIPSQSHMPSPILSAPSQPSFLQSHQPSQSHHQHHQQQQQPVQHAFNISMGGAAPKTSSTGLPPNTQALQSAAQQLQADVKQHQQVNHHTSHSQQQATGEHVQQRNQQHAIVEYVQQKNPQQAMGDQGSEQRQQQQQPAVVQASAPELETASTLQHALSGGANRGAVITEESLDGDEQDEGEKGSGGNRWPRQEALALLKIRSEMDAAFRDSSVKGPLWEEISRKLAEMGYQRSAKKCKEKFENVHKYYKRTKEGKTGRQDGKSYRFFTQLEALYGKAADSTALLNLSNQTNNNNNNNNNNNDTSTNNNTSNSSLVSLNHVNHVDNGATGLAVINVPNNSTINNGSNNHGVSLSTAVPAPFNITAAAAATNVQIARTLERVESVKAGSEHSGAPQFFIETSDDDDDDDEDDNDEFDEPARECEAPPKPPPSSSKKRKRKPMKKYLAFFEKVLKTVLDKQEHMQQKFLEALERRDQDRMIREEAWKRQEMARLNREHDVRAAERALSASREASLVAFLQKMTGQSVPLPLLSNTTIAVQQAGNQQSTALVPADCLQNEYNNTDKDGYDPMNKRWPKPEVLSLIKLRTRLNRRFNEPGSKAVLWEEISADMTALGYSRTSKRCKEKWENINKYFKKAKDSNKKRPENAKTCPYFHHLNALYKEGLLGGGGGGGSGSGVSASQISSKQVTLTERGEEPSDDVMEEQGNTSVNVGDSGQTQQEVESVALLALPAASRDIAGTGSNLAPANAGTMASANLALSTASTPSGEAKMHLLMGSASSDKDASVKKMNEMPPPLMDTSTSGNNRLRFNLDHGIGSAKSLAAGLPQQQEQSHA